jgi:DNA polymerase-1
MAQNFLFGNLPQLKASREADQEILKKSRTSTKSRTRTVRTGQSAGNQWAQKVTLATGQAKQLLVNDGSILDVRDEDTFFKYIKEMRYNRAGSIDTETTGLDPIDDHIVGLCLYTPGQKAVYVPSKHTDFDDNVLENQLPYEVLIEGLREILDIPYDYHNAKFDWRFIRHSLGLEMTIGWCSNLAANYLNEYEDHRLKPLWDKYVSKTDDKSATFNELFKGIPFNYVPLDIAYLYAGKDPKITYELAEYQRQFLLPDSPKAVEKGLAEAGKFLVDTEIPLIAHVARMEDKGVEIDAEFGKVLEVKYTAKLDEAKEDIHEVISQYDFTKLPPDLRSKLDTPINIASTDQLGIIFYDMLGFNNGNRRKPRSTDADALEYIRAKNPKYKELLDKIQEFRGMSKLLSTYVIKMPKEVKVKTGRLHANFNQYGARTGRFSSTGPNMQNIPSRGEKREIRKMVKAALGKVFLSADFSQQEPRVLAHLCWTLFGDSGMMDAYKAGKDLYVWMASEVYKVAYDLCKEKNADGSPNAEGKKRRESVKSILLGLMYGMEIDTLAEGLGVPKQEAQRYMDMVFDTFPAIKQVVEYFQDMAKEHGYVTTIYGRKCRIPDMQLPKYEFVRADNREEHIEDPDIINYYWNQLDNCRSGKRKKEIWQDANDRGIWINDNTFKISEAERQVLNSVVQGSSADITKKAMKLIGEDALIKEWGFDMTLSIHDEVDGETWEETALKVGDRLSELMIISCADKISVPMKVDVDISRIWTGEDITEELKLKYAS